MGFSLHSVGNRERELEEGLKKKKEEEEELDFRPIWG